MLDVGSGGGRLIYEQAGYLHLFDPAKGTSTRLKIGVATDLVEARPRFVKGAKYIRNAAVSPSGARAVFEFRGEIVTVPAEKGDPRNLTESPGVHERSPAWSPDGKSIAYFSDEGGEYRLHVRSADGKGKAKVYEPQGRRLLRGPRLVARQQEDRLRRQLRSRSSGSTWTAGEVKKIASEPIYGPAGCARCGPPGRPTRSGSPTRWATRPRITRSSPTSWPAASRGRSPTA